MMFLLLLLLLPACLLPPGTQAGEIIGGHEARPHSRPYMAFLEISRSSICGGFLIREDFVLTAAHCQGRSYKVTLGAHNIRTSERNRQVIGVSRAIPHPDYDSKYFSNDIMLLKLARKATLSSEVKVLRLPSPLTRVRPGQVCSVAGWGRTSVHNAEHSKTLQEVDLTVLSDVQCRVHFSHIDFATQLCAGRPKKTKNSFQGDSGGPLVCNNVAQGIVSHGYVNGRPPSLYTRISPYLPWINKAMQNASES